MKTLTAADILSAADFKIEAVDVPEWGGRVFVREMSAAAREEFFEPYQTDVDGAPADPPKRVNARVVAYTACDEQGQLLFTADQVEKLAQKCGPVVDRVYDVAARLNKLRKIDHDGEKKESAALPPAGSPTDSHSRGE